MSRIRPKRRFAQHFLKDGEVLEAIMDLIRDRHREGAILEIGPGTGALTRLLWEAYRDQLTLIELDRRCADHLESEFDGIGARLVRGDFLRIDPAELIAGPTTVVGNFPYNISTEIIFRILDVRDRVPLVVGMFQKEVAERLASGPGSRVYGVISVLVQLHYDVEVALDIPPEHFDPPPKVDSAVIVMSRHQRYAERDMEHFEPQFRKVVKAAFSMRRKKLRNALSRLGTGREVPEKFRHLRAEALSVEDFIELTGWYIEGTNV